MLGGEVSFASLLDANNKACSPEALKYAKCLNQCLSIVYGQLTGIIIIITIIAGFCFFLIL